MITVISVFLVGWVAAAVLGTLAYFLGEQRKPIHERNWRSESFENLSQSLTGKEIDYSERIPGFFVDNYSATNLPS